MQIDPSFMSIIIIIIINFSKDECSYYMYEFLPYIHVSCSYLANYFSHNAGGSQNED